MCQVNKVEFFKKDILLTTQQQRKKNHIFSIGGSKKKQNKEEGINRAWNCSLGAVTRDNKVVHNDKERERG